MRRFFWYDRIRKWNQLKFHYLDPTTIHYAAAKHIRKKKIQFSTLWSNHNRKNAQRRQLLPTIAAEPTAPQRDWASRGDQKTPSAASSYRSWEGWPPSRPRHRRRLPRAATPWCSARRRRGEVGLKVEVFCHKLAGGWSSTCRRRSSPATGSWSSQRKEMLCGLLNGHGHGWPIWILFAEFTAQCPLARNVIGLTDPILSYHDHYGLRFVPIKHASNFLFLMECYISHSLIV